MQTRRSPTFPHFFDLLFISWNAGSWDEEITNILSSEGNTSNRFKIRSSEFVTIIFIQKTYPCQRLRQYDHTLDSCGFSSPESTQKNEYNTLNLASGRKNNSWIRICVNMMRNHPTFGGFFTDRLVADIFCSLEFLASSSPRLLSRLKKGGGGESYLFCSRPRAKDFISKTAWHGDFQFSNSLRHSCGCNCFFHQFTCSKFLAEAKGMAENGTVL